MNLSNHRYYNVNVNQKASNNVNGNVTYKNREQRISEVRAIASKLATSLNEEHNIKFFYKVAWQLPEARIWINLEQAQHKNNPGAYFVSLCKLEMTS